PPRLTLFPYTTLFRSIKNSCPSRCAMARLRSHPTNRMVGEQWAEGARSPSLSSAARTCSVVRPKLPNDQSSSTSEAARAHGGERSEEHTSELQSRFDL